jgi:STE24 endopeptidase
VGLAAAGSATLVGLLTFVFPVLIAPVFNKFAPLPEGPLRERLLARAAADGVPVRDVLVAEASRRTTALNA